MESLSTYVERHELDKLLSPDLMESMHTLHREAGELLIRAGDPVRDLMFFVEGRAKVYSILDNGSSLLARFYVPFDVLGDVELFSLDTYMLNVEALTETVCLCVPAEAIRRAATRNTALLIYLCGRLGRKLRDFNVSASVNLRYPVENRLASYLLAVTGDSVDKCLATENLGELADILGTSYRQLTRVVRLFRDAGFLDARRGRLRVLDRKGLEPLARDVYI
jgi:CRP-like cAMP-binding protein